MGIGKRGSTLKLLLSNMETISCFLISADSQSTIAMSQAFDEESLGMKVKRNMF